MNAIYEFTFNGVSPLILHQDNVSFQEKTKAWQKDPRNKTVSVAGDDRSPAWSWIGCLYISEGKCVMPSDNVMTALRTAGAKVQVPNGKNGKTFKDVTQYGIIPGDECFDLTVGGKTISTTKILDLEGDNEFPKHEALARSLGFELFTKRAKIGQSKHVRVRPRFDSWSIKGSLHVTDQSLTDAVMAEILSIAGDRCGLGDWRPSSKTPGPYGRFTVDLKRVG